MIDAGLILLGLPLWFLFQGRKKKGDFSGNLSRIEFANLTSKDLPDKKQLLEFEKLSRQEGSGIEFHSLIGLWKFVYVWKQQTDKENLIASSLLRTFSASLELREKGSKNFSLTNSIKFGLLSISFVGVGNLKGKQPLLHFFFDHIEVKFGSKVLFTRSIEIAEEKDGPFFSLIAIEENSKWLSARGRGGGLALWVKNE